MNLLRQRAFGDTSENYGSFGAVTLDEILNERSRELYWECHRRTDWFVSECLPQPDIYGLGKVVLQMDVR